MILIVCIAVFAATALGVLAVYLLAEERRASPARRIGEVAAPAGDSGGRAGGWAAALREKAAALSGRRRDAAAEVAERVAGGEPTGTALLLNQAGFRSPGARTVFLAVRTAAPVLLASAGLAYGKAAGLANGPVLLLAATGSATGWLLPATFLRSRSRRRQEEIRDALPDALDLLVVCVEAGLGLNAAFIRITEEFRLSGPALSEEFDVVNREMVAGKPRIDALRALAARTGVEDVKALVAMLVQTERLGTSLAQSLRVHSDSLRTKRRQRAEEAAAKTTIKLVFPLVFFLFPALFIVILGPGAIQIARILFPIASGG